MKSDKASTAITQQMIHNLGDPRDLEVQEHQGENVGQTFVLAMRRGSWEHPVRYGTPWASPNFAIGYKSSKIQIRRSRGKLFQREKNNGKKTWKQTGYTSKDRLVVFSSPPWRTTTGSHSAYCCSVVSIEIIKIFY